MCADSSRDAARLGYSRTKKLYFAVTVCWNTVFCRASEYQSRLHKIANVSQLWKDFMELYQMGVCHCSIYPIQLPLHLLQQPLSSMGCFSETTEPAFWHIPYTVDEILLGKSYNLRILVETKRVKSIIGP